MVRSGTAGKEDSLFYVLIDVFCFVFNGQFWQSLISQVQVFHFNLNDQILPRMKIRVFKGTRAELSRLYEAREGNNFMM